jgi:predicted methyltransferase
MKHTAILSASALLALCLAGAAAGAGNAALPAYIAAAISDSARPAADTERDADRKPGATLAFAGVKPGQQVLELAPGRGYYTRLLSAVVGPKGKLYVVTSPPRPDSPPGPSPVQVIASDPHYSNVTVIVSRVAELKPPEGMNVVWTSQNYHDFHNIPNVNVLDIDKAVFAALKPGGIYLVLDHAAEQGSGFRDTSTLHRIDEEAVKKEVLQAGFELMGESEALRNAKDPRTAKVFDASIRGKTDQFILKFRKPK